MHFACLPLEHTSSYTVLYPSRSPALCIHRTKAAISAANDNDDYYDDDDDDVDKLKRSSFCYYQQTKDAN